MTTWTDLIPEERLALAALARTLIRLDRTYSRDESKQLQEIALQLGDAEALWDAIEEAEQRVKSPEELRAVTLKVTRPDARELILEVLESLGTAGTISDAEQQMLNELRAMWGMPAAQ